MELSINTTADHPTRQTGEFYFAIIGEIPRAIDTTLLLAFEDVTERRAIERAKEELLRKTEELLRQKDVLLRELEHRVANSLQIIASILMLKARTVTSEETRQHLRDAHQRVMALAAVQEHLHPSERHDQMPRGIV